jgi:hypothetical protein
MATKKMKKGEIYADIFDSPETIKQAQLDGYGLVNEEELKLQEMKIDELRQKAAELKLDIKSTKKDDFVAAILEAEAAK